MQKEKKVDDILQFLIVFLFLLFKYVEMWTFLVFNEIYESKFIMILLIFVGGLIAIRMKLKKNEVKKGIFWGIIFAVIVLLSKRMDFIASFFIAVTYFKNDNGDRKFIKNFFISSIILFSLTIILGITNILPSISTIRHISNEEVLYRSNLGFYGANSLFLNFYPIVLAYIVLFFNNNWKKNLFDSGVILAISLVFYEFTNCRAGMLCVIVTLIIANFINSMGNKLIKNVTKYIFPILFTISMISAIIFGVSTDNAISRLSSGRMYFWNYYIRKIKFSFFGTEAIKTLPLDNLYLQFFYIYGFVSFVLYIYFTVIASKKMIKSKKLIFLILAFSIYGFFENNIAFNFNFLVTLMLIYVLGEKENMFFIKEKSEENIDEERKSKHNSTNIQF